MGRARVKKPMIGSPQAHHQRRRNHLGGQSDWAVDGRTEKGCWKRLEVGW